MERFKQSLLRVPLDASFGSCKEGAQTNEVAPNAHQVIMHAGCAHIEMGQVRELEPGGGGGGGGVNLELIYKSSIIITEMHGKMSQTLTRQK